MSDIDLWFTVQNLLYSSCYPSLAEVWLNNPNLVPV